VGKSTLLNAILGQKIAPTTHKPQTTRRALRGVETRGDNQIVFVDTPGLHEPKQGLHHFMVKEALDTARDVDVVAFVVEAHGTGIAKDDADVLAQLTAEGVTRPMVLIINKIDQLDDKKMLLPLLQAWGETGRFQALIPVSAFKKDGLDILIDDLCKRIPEGEFIFPPDTLTDTAEKDIAAELIREKVMLELQEELPYRTAVVVEEFNEERRADTKKPIVKVSAVIHVERDSQKAMVIGKGGERIKSIGMRARKELEHLLGCQVMLEMLVRVQEDWTRDPRGLRKLGYTHTKRKPT
jgi:GTP-binding protein Era